MALRTYSVPGMHCANCKAAVTGAVEGVRGVESIEVDLEARLVTVRGDGLDHAALVAAIEEAGYDPELIAS